MPDAVTIPARAELIKIEEDTPALAKLRLTVEGLRERYPLPGDTPAPSKLTLIQGGASDG